MATDDRPGLFRTLLQQYRAGAGLSQEELAERSGLSRRAISDLERGARRTPRPATVRRLADALHVDNAERAELFGAARADLASGVRPTLPHQTLATTSGATTIIKQPQRAELPRDAQLQQSAVAIPEEGVQAGHNLPVQLTSFVGRVRETVDIRRELAKTRLLTLAGPGGVGKTRLALRVAEEELGTFRDGVWFVGLAPLTEPTLVPQRVANVYAVRENPGEPLITTLTRALQPLHLMLILDNCEHLLGACVELVYRLLLTCPHIVVLTTSREMLGLAAETLWRVPPLRVGEVDVLHAHEEVVESEAMALFVERARAVWPGFSVGPRNAPRLLELCRRLEGMPLAIELAASRVKVLGIEQIAERLGDHFHLPASRDPTVESRHQTLEKTIRWSYELLTPTEQALFARISVFAGGWSLEAMEAVAGGESSVANDVVDVLERLVDKSLVLVDNPVDSSPRYRLLEPLRQFGQDRLQERGEMRLIQDRHAAFFLKQFEQAEQPFYTSGLNPAWLSRLDPEQDNLRAALRWLLEQGEIESALRLAAAARPFWFIRGSLAEGRRWLEEALALEPHEEVHAGAALASSGVSGGSRPSEHKARRLAVRAKALMALGHLAIYQGDVTVCQRAVQRSVQIYRQLHDTWGAVYPLQLLGRAAELRADFAEARRYLEEAIATGQSTGQPVVVAAALVRLAEVATEEDGTAEAQRLTEEALKIANARGATGLICQAMSVLAEVQYRLGRRDAARLAWEEALARAREIGYGTVWLIVILFGLGRLERWQGATDRSRVLFAEGLTLAHEMSRWELARGLEAMVEVATAEGHAESALQLAGTAAALRDAMGTPLWPSEGARLETALARARQSLSQFEADAAWMRGWTRPADQTLGLALELLGQPQGATIRQPPRFFSATSSRP